MAGFLNPKDRGRTSLTRPAETNQGGNQRRWYDPTKSPRLYAQDMNRLLAQGRTAADFWDVPTEEGDDHVLRKTIEAGALAVPYLARRVVDKIGDVHSVLDEPGAVKVRGPNAALAINAAIAAGFGTILIPDGFYDLNTAIVPKSGVRVIASPKAKLYQRAAYAIENPTNAYVGHFWWEGGEFIYDRTPSSKFHACWNMRNHNFCDINTLCTGYDDQILVLNRPLARNESQNNVYNRYRIRALTCGIGVWLEGYDGDSHRTDHVGNGTTANLASTFNVTWPSDLLVMVWEQSTGLIRRWVLETDYTIASGAAGSSGVVTVTPLVAVPSGDIVMMRYAHTRGGSTTRCPISNDRYDLTLQSIARAGIYAVRWCDSIRPSGTYLLGTNGAAHFWLNPAKIRNSQCDYWTFDAPVCGKRSSVTDMNSIAVIRSGPGFTKNKGFIDIDGGFTGGAVDLVDTEYVTLTGTVSCAGGGTTTVTGTGTQFTKELTIMGDTVDRIRIVHPSNPANTLVRAISAIVSDTQLTLATGVSPAFSGVVGQKVNPKDAISWVMIPSQYSTGGVSAHSVVARRKAGHYAQWTATIPSGETALVTHYPHTLDRTPSARHITVHPQGVAPSGHLFADSITATSVRVNVSAAPGTALPVTVIVDISDFS